MRGNDNQNKYTVVFSDSSLEAVAANNFLKGLKRKKGKFLTALVIWFLTHTDTVFYDEGTDKIYSLQEGREALKQMLPPNYMNGDMDSLPIEVVYNLMKTNKKQEKKSETTQKVSKCQKRYQTEQIETDTIKKNVNPVIATHQETIEPDENGEDDEDDNWMLNMVSTK